MDQGIPQVVEPKPQTSHPIAWSIPAEPANHPFWQRSHHKDEETPLDEQPALGQRLTDQTFGVSDRNGSENGANQGAPTANRNPDHHLNREGHRHVLRRDDPGLNRVKSSTDASKAAGNRKHNGFKQRWVVPGEAQPRLVISNRDQHITKTPTHDPAKKQPNQDHHDRGEPIKPPLHLCWSHLLTEELGHIGGQTIGAIDQLLLAVEEIEKNKQGRLGQDREVDPLDPVAEDQIAEHRSQGGRDEPDRDQGEQWWMERLPERGETVNAIKPKKLWNAVR